MIRPRKAVVLAAGYGARLLPLTLCRPKPLCPIWGKPALVHALEGLRDWGVREVLVNVHCHAGKIVDYMRLHPVPGLRCQISFEPDILGTGGVLHRARWFLDEHPFWMLNADALVETRCRPLIKAFDTHAALASLWLIPDNGPRTVETDGGLITTFRSSRAGSPGTTTFSGLHLISPRVLDYLPSTGEASIVVAYERAMQAGERVAGVVVPDSYWADIGTPRSYLEAHADIVTRATKGQAGRRFLAGQPCCPASGTGRFLSVGRGVTIAPGAQFVNSIIWDHAILAPHAIITDAIVADGAMVRGNVSYIAMRADTLDDPIFQDALRRLGWDPQTVTALPLPPRGSARTFTRIHRGNRTAMLVNYSLERPENALYATHTRFLIRQDIRVPSVLLDRPDVQLTVFEDAGSQSLEDLAPALSRRRCLALYRQTLDAVVRLHGPASAAARRERLVLSKPFDRHVYEWEQNLFCEQFLQRHAQLDAATLRTVRQELAALIPRLLRAPRVLIHRDLQSSNVLVSRGKTFLIDFQGMRFGTAAYDLASLLCDPYVNLATELRDELLDYYVRHASGGEAVRSLFWVAAVERLTQALGAYGRLGANPATASFLRHIPAGVRQLLQAVTHVSTLPTLKAQLEKWLNHG